MLNFVYKYVRIPQLNLSCPVITPHCIILIQNLVSTHITQLCYIIREQFKMKQVKNCPKVTHIGLVRSSKLIKCN